MSEDKRDGVNLVIVFAVLHLLCCGLPLLLLSGFSLSFLTPRWPLLGAALAVLGVVGFIWYLKRGCTTCLRNEGRRRGVVCRTSGTGATCHPVELDHASPSEGERP